MTGSVQLLLDEHVSRIFQRTLRERGFDVDHAKDRLGEQTRDRELITWCSENDVVLCSNDVDDFRPLAEEIEHAGLFLYRPQSLPTDDPETLARVVETVVDQYGPVALENEVVDLGEWYEWLTG